MSTGGKYKEKTHANSLLDLGPQDLLLDEILAFERLIHGIEVSLEGDLLCGMGEALIGKPDTVLLFQTAPA
jgi:hypothetical protein